MCIDLTAAEMYTSALLKHINLVDFCQQRSVKVVASCCKPPILPTVPLAMFVGMVACQFIYILQTTNCKPKPVLA